MLALNTIESVGTFINIAHVLAKKRTACYCRALLYALPEAPQNRKQKRTAEFFATKLVGLEQIELVGPGNKEPKKTKKFIRQKSREQHQSKTSKILSSMI